MGDKANTLLNVTSSMGEFGSAGTTPANSKIPMEKNEAKIPSLNTKLITVTEVKMSSDLRSARAYVIPLGGKETKKIVNILTEFSYLVRKALSKKLDIKFLPKLYFVEDKSFDYAERIEKLIKENKRNEI